MLYLPTWDNIILWIIVIITTRDKHFYDEDSIEDGGTPINCNIVVSKPELSDVDKVALKEQAMEQFKQEQLLELRKQSQPKAQPKPTATAPKAGAEIDSIPNLFDEL
ncbi:Cas9 inhibitor AcrIIA9 family protein [uncultured Duncaniella sp.]|uniref:Cas9 inhibitor AcrIIA9 family protein n=1 Tax=uncultured Duncaniella sp. TaxID=2768039 RepID=UPI0025A9CB0B|nr:Cas9 inhibitor AcrIIA9 family protein [uncultured Duncaniella sp.]